MLRVAVRAPGASGVNRTTMVQLAPAATELPQLLFSVKSPALAPLIVTPETLNGTGPVLVKVTI
jgi:hypothetical protein